MTEAVLAWSICPDIKSADCERDNLGDIVKHKHCEVIKKWADGAEIQSLEDEGWVDCPHPSWVETCEYRVKPETVRYRVGICRDIKTGNVVPVFAGERKGEFIRWVDDAWQEVEV